MDFDSLPDESVAQAPAQKAPPPVLPSFDALPDESKAAGEGFLPSESKYGIHAFPLPQNEAERELGKGALESLAKGFVGPTVTAGAEKLLTKAGVKGLSPEEQAQREESLKEVNPAIPALTEAAGFGLGALSGTGEAALLGKAGEAALGATKLGETTNLGARLAAGSVKAGTELGALQADNEVARVINGNSKGIGDAVANVGLATALGVGFGGAVTGVGIAGKGALDAIGLKEFSDRLAYRGANAHPNEAMEKEFHDAIEQYHNMNSELTGPKGLKAQALEAIMPESVDKGIQSQVQTISDKAQNAITNMVGKRVPDRYISKFTTHLNDLQEVATEPNVSPGRVFDALNGFKKELQDYSKGNFGPFAIPSYHEAYDFLNITKNLGHDVRVALEDPKVWDKVANLQKTLNESWSRVLPAVKDVQGKFMEKVGGEYVPSPQKFSTYINQSGKATTQTIRQKMMGNFVDSIENHFKATDAAYKAAGVENPFPAPGLGALKDSLKKTSIGSKLADLWYDKLGSEALGNAAGAAVGEAVLPGFGGAYAGKEVLGKLFGSIIKPIAEKVSNLRAYQGAMSFVKNVALGNQKMVNAVGKLFLSGSKTLPLHLIPDDKKIQSLDDKLKKAHGDQSSLMDVSQGISHYLPDHAMQLSKTAMGAVAYLNSQRPSNPKMSPLDKEMPPSKAQNADFERKLTIAEQPLMVLQHIQDGTLLPSDVETMKALYPEYYDQMSGQIMTEMTEHLHGDNDIPYKIRQSLSLFLGQPLDSTMTPQSIQSIQATFSQNAPQPQQQGGGKSKGNTSKLGKVASNMQTPGQAREARSNKV